MTSKLYYGFTKYCELYEKILKYDKENKIKAAKVAQLKISNISVKESSRKQ
jgi:hypothetical protein